MDAIACTYIQIWMIMNTFRQVVLLGKHHGRKKPNLIFEDVFFLRHYIGIVVYSGVKRKYCIYNLIVNFSFSLIEKLGKVDTKKEGFFWQ